MITPARMDLSDMLKAHHAILGAALQEFAEAASTQRRSVEVQEDALLKDRAIFEEKMKRGLAFNPVAPDHEELLAEAKQIARNQAQVIEDRDAEIRDLSRKLSALEKSRPTPVKQKALSETTNHLLEKTAALKEANRELAETKAQLRELRDNPPVSGDMSKIEQLERHLAASEKDLSALEGSLATAKEGIEKERKKTESTRSMLYRERRKALELKDELEESETRCEADRKEFGELKAQWAVITSDHKVSVQELEQTIAALNEQLEAANVEVVVTKTTVSDLQGEMSRAAEVLRKAIDSDDLDKMDTYLVRALGILEAPEREDK